MQVNIKRFEHDEGKGSRGLILVNGEFFGYSIEQPPNYNEPFKSRIPAGTYDCILMPTTNHGNRFIVMNVPCRYDIILFHVGNTQASFAGCIGAGDGMGMLHSERAVWNTSITCDNFLELVGDVDKLTLIIEDI